MNKGNLCFSPGTSTVPPEYPSGRKPPLQDGPVARLPLVDQISTAGYPPAPKMDGMPLTALERMQSIGGAVADSGFRSDVARGLADVANRTAASVLGGPVDLAATALSALGYRHPAPVGGSEWIGQQMEHAGAVTPERRPAAELLGSLAGPSAAAKAAAGLGFAAAMSPEGKARLLADLTAGKGSGTYRLGDVTQGQAAGLDALFGRPTPSRDVFMTDKALGHIVERRMGDRGFTPEDVTRFAESALERRARPELDVSKAGQNPALRNTNALDQVTGRRHDAFMPFKQGEEGYEVRTVYAPGLPPRNEKTPKR